MKQFIIRKRVMAETITEALQKEKKAPIDDCWVDQDFKQSEPATADAIGFEV